MRIRLNVPLRFDHFVIPLGEVIDLPADLAKQAVQREIAEHAEPLKAVVVPQEIRRRGRPPNPGKMAR